MSAILQGSLKWCVENGSVRFSTPLTGTLEVVSKIDWDPTVFPDLDDFIFDGDDEVVRLFYTALRDLVALGIARNMWTAELSKPSRRALLRQTVDDRENEYRKSFALARNVLRARESRVTRFQPIVGRSPRPRDYSER